MLERAFTTYEIPKAKLAYNIQFDQEAKLHLETSRLSLNPEEYQRRQDQLQRRTTENLKSEIRERFCTLEYETAYRLIDGKLISAQHDEPFSQVIKRGIEYRQKHGSTDTSREQAELIGFERIEQMLQEDSGAKTVVSISPRGHKDSVYQHNVFDIFQVQDNNTILMSRFTSTASYADFQKAARMLNPEVPQPAILSDAYFLAHPFETTASLNEILEAIELDSRAIAKAYVETVIEKCLPVIMRYVNNPSEKNYKAAVNLADILGNKKTVSNSQLNDLTIKQLNDSEIYPPAITSQHLTMTAINYLASLPVRQVATGCGISGSKTLGIGQAQVLNPWSVADFAPLNSGEEDKGDFPCPQCGYTITYGSGIKQCPSCGLEATCV